MALLSATIEFVIKLVIFAAVAFGGLMVGIRMRKRKEEKEVQKGNE